MPNELGTVVGENFPPIAGLASLTGPIFQRAQKNADQREASPSSRAELNYMTAEARDLKAEVERLRAERDRLLENQRRILELLGTDRPERLIHDLRNVLNERELYRALAETVM